MLYCVAYLLIQLTVTEHFDTAVHIVSDRKSLSQPAYPREYKKYEEENE